MHIHTVTSHALSIPTDPTTTHPYILTHPSRTSAPQPQQDSHSSKGYTQPGAARPHRSGQIRIQCVRGRFHIAVGMENTPGLSARPTFAGFEDEEERVGAGDDLWGGDGEAGEAGLGFGFGGICCIYTCKVGWCWREGVVELVRIDLDHDD
ncbi:uncharacterized protein BJX67DRAFT_48371 [Aspergillus lucknowensis]|uniref:Uncharacterized protein n=1 Tax=Aspergillus lucknowensis TaxID=176173 RepID=A0ABR4LWA0_9EURO